MNVVIPMAGRGKRFLDAGFSSPKPLIDVLGRPMYEWAVASLPLELATSLTFVCLQDHLEGGELEQSIQDRYGWLDPTVVALDAVTEGQACTVLAGLDALADMDAPLLVYNADTYAPHRLSDMARIVGDGVDGALGVVTAEGDHWSFVALGDDGFVIRTTEKVRISSLACTGLYYFGSTRAFAEVAMAAVAEGRRVGGEFYVAPLYNALIEGGGRVTILEPTSFHPMGTPAERVAFLADPPPVPPVLVRAAEG